MTLNASVNWYVRAAGNALNGGGWDPLISGAGVNYADADSPILSPTDLATTGAVATVTSATGGFTANMVGNCLRIASGTNFTAGYYFIITYTNANTIVLDRACATGVGSGGVGRVGGAFPTPWSNLPTGGTTTAPTLTSPLAGGHTVYIRGAGADPPTAADYTMPDAYSTYPSGTSTAGLIRFIGVNGRPRIDVPQLFAYNSANVLFENLFLRALSSAANQDYGTLSLVDRVRNVTFEQNGIDKPGARSINSIRGCRFQNSGSSSPGSYPAIVADYGSEIVGSLINGWRGSGIDYGGGTTSYGVFTITDTIVANCRSASVPSIRAGIYSISSRTVVSGLTVYGGNSDGCEFHSALYGTDDTYGKEMILALSLYNCLFVGCGGYGVNFKNGSATLYEALRGMVNHNGFYGCTSGRYNRLSDGPNDVILTASPFVDAINGDFRLNSTAGAGAACKNVAFPTGHPAA